jgi:hypothetical protein
MYAENECLTSSQNMCLKEFNNLSFLKQNPNAYENEKGKRTEEGIKKREKGDGMRSEEGGERGEE